MEEHRPNLLQSTSQAVHETDITSHHPLHRLPLRGSHFVVDALANDLAFELLKRQKHIEVRRPTDVVVLNCWVTETKEALLLSRISHNLGHLSSACKSGHHGNRCDANC